MYFHSRSRSQAWRHTRAIYVFWPVCVFWVLKICCQNSPLRSKVSWLLFLANDLIFLGATLPGIQSHQIVRDSLCETNDPSQLFFHSIMTWLSPSRRAGYFRTLSTTGVYSSCGFNTPVWWDLYQIHMSMCDCIFNSSSQDGGPKNGCSKSIFMRTRVLLSVLLCRPVNTFLPPYHCNLHRCFAQLTHSILSLIDADEVK